jgi:hypothetical protein
VHLLDAFLKGGVAQLSTRRGELDDLGPDCNVLRACGD